MTISIDKKCLGTPQHMVVSSTGVSWTNAPPSNSLTWGCSVGDDLSAAAPLLGEKLNLDFGEEYQKAMQAVCPDIRDIPWSQVVPKKKFERILRKFLKGVEDIKKEEVYEYLTSSFFPSLRMLNSFEPAKVDPEIVRTLLMTVKNTSAIQSFMPVNRGYAKQVKYSLTGTRTGRMIVSEGPSILTLKKEHRKIITSRFQDGRIIEIDFVSLEPRLALSLVGRNPAVDVYASIQKDVFEGTVSRQTAKLATLCTIYGGGIKKLKEITSMSGESVRQVMQKLDDYFCKKDIIDAILQEVDEAGCYKNYFGRPIFPNSNEGYLVYNNYIQSSAVDLALQGFRKITNQLADMKSIPLFVIHDALVVDLHPDEYNKVKEMLSDPLVFDNLPGKYYLEQENFNA